MRAKRTPRHEAPDLKNPVTPVCLSRKAAALVLVLLLLAAACGGSDNAIGTTASDTTATTTSTITTTTTLDTSTVPPDTTTPDTTTTTTPHDTTTTTTTTTTAPATGHHGAAGEPTRYDANLSDATQTITVEVVGGAPAGGHQRVKVDLGSVVALKITSDLADEVHVHGYDILRAISAGHPAHFAFSAEIPGVFEVELHGSGRLLLLLEIS